VTIRLEDLPSIWPSPPKRGVTTGNYPTINRKTLTRMYVRLQRSHALIEALKYRNDLARYSNAVNRWWYPAAQSFYAACAALRSGGTAAENGFVPVGRNAQDWAEEYRGAWVLAEAER
jgi:hypothetical protein